MGWLHEKHLKSWQAKTLSASVPLMAAATGNALSVQSWVPAASKIKSRQHRLLNTRRQIPFLSVARWTECSVRERQKKGIGRIRGERGTAYDHRAGSGDTAFLGPFVHSLNITECRSSPELGDSGTKASSALDVQPRQGGAMAGLRAEVLSWDQVLVTFIGLLGGPACSQGASHLHTCTVDRI